MSGRTLLARSEVDKRHTWNAESVFPGWDEWEASFASVESRLPDLAEFKGHLGDGPGALADWIEASESLQKELSRVAFYAVMTTSCDALDQDAVAKADRARGLASRASATMSFAEPEMLAIGIETLQKWTAEEPRLAIYGHFLDRLAKRAPHVRSEEVEEVLSQSLDPMSAAGQVHSILANADIRFRPARDATGEEHEVAQGTVDALLRSEDRELRKSAYESYHDAHLALKNTMANALSGGIKRDVYVARVRRYPSSLDAALSAGHVPTSVFHSMLDTYQKNLGTWHRYWAIRKRALKLDRQYPYDTRANLSPEEPQVSYEQAVDWISEGLAPLGDDYVTILRRGSLEDRWVDVYPNRGKRMGAFSFGAPGTHPFIMMSFKDDVFSLSTLAHELGHSMHSYFTKRDQPYVYSGYGLFMAEVASNFNQALVRAHLLKTNTDPNFQIAVIEEAMANFFRYFYIMPSLARFELETHERVERGEALTADTLIDLMADLLYEGYGSAVEVDRERVGITWAEFHTHLYSNFYVYQYATGIAGANWLAQGILDGKPGAVENYRRFLSSGGSQYPLDGLREAGVDMNSPEPVERAFGVMASMVDRLEKLIG